MQRSLRIPRGVDQSKIQANYENGSEHERREGNTCAMTTINSGISNQLMTAC